MTRLMKSCSGCSGNAKTITSPRCGRHVRPDARVRVRDRRAVAELVDEDVVADHERRDHRAARDLEGLDDERAQRERDGHGHQDRLDVLAHLALAPAPEVHVDLAVGVGERLDEAVLVERDAIHRVAQRRRAAPRRRSRSFAASSRTTALSWRREDRSRPRRGARARARTSRADAAGRSGRSGGARATRTGAGGAPPRARSRRP